MSKIKNIGILTSGGDSPGMNCAIRSAVRTALFNKINIFGIYRGYSGLLANEIKPLTASSVGNIIQRGGTILQSSRCPEFFEAKSRKMAKEIMDLNKLDGLIVIGGDGSFNGAHLFNIESGIPVIGIPGTIDNDISNTEYTIGFDTALSTAIEAVDKIRDTASSHARTFIIEVMGRNSSGIATHVGVCTGAENIVLPGVETDYDQIVSDINRGISRGKNSSILIVAEGTVPGRSYEIQKNLKEKYNLKAHLCILGHIQRGGSPSPIDRFRASVMGNMAVKALIEGKTSHATIYKDGQIALTELTNCLEKKNDAKPEILDLAKTLSI
jgi:6-phosphofructokinase 1